MQPCGAIGGAICMSGSDEGSGKHAPALCAPRGRRVGRLVQEPHVHERAEIAGQRPPRSEMESTRFVSN